MSDAITASPLPPLYARWMLDALGSPIPNETRATCTECAMLPQPGRPPPPVTFRADTKCCTFQPELHNFLVGGVLGDPDRGLAWAKEMLALRMAKRVGVTPLGIRADAFAGLIYDRVVELAPESFGRMKEVRCPYYIQQGGACGVWRHRNAICSTWFCKYERGGTGLTFWKTMLGLLRAAERAASMWAVLQLDPGPRAKTLLLFLDQRRDSAVREIVEGIPDHAYRTLWGTWFGRELEFYREAGRLVGELTWADVRRIAGPELTALEDIARYTHDRQLSQALPPGVARGPDALFQIHPTRPDHLRVTTRALGYDPLDLPAAILPLIPVLCGRDPVEAMRELHANGRGELLDEAVVRKLLDYGVLVPVGDA